MPASIEIFASDLFFSAISWYAFRVILLGLLLTYLPDPISYLLLDIFTPFLACITFMTSVADEKIDMFKPPMPEMLLMTLVSLCLIFSGDKDFTELFIDSRYYSSNKSMGFISSASS